MKSEVFMLPIGIDFWHKRCYSSISCVSNSRDDSYFSLVSMGVCYYRGNDYSSFSCRREKQDKRIEDKYKRMKKGD